MHVDVMSVTDFHDHLCEQFAITHTDFPLDAPMTELGFDSLARMELLAIMDELGFLVTTDDLLDSTTLRALYESAAARMATS